ncbi:putative metabolite transport protein YfiG [Colletotrichum sp. SAR 10_77]|nr:putative metabolite transport protein YfiG [Colletotrichum sp. SAR 10_75]KAI8250427.1 putative metabolite transport protein YfiG [Colletotrichum sp. SAR 10_77]
MADEKRAGGADPSAGVEVSNIEKARRGSQATVDLNDNKEAKIKNPLLGINRSELLRDVEHFARDKGLDEYLPMLKKGALVAQDPTGYEEIDGAEALEPDEIQALRDEVLHKWRIPKILYLTIITCSIGAAVQGWDQTGSNGANLSFPTVFGIGSNSHHDTLLVGLVNSAPYIGSAFIGCWLSDPLNNWVGRRGTIFFAANFCIWAARDIYYIHIQLQVEAEIIGRSNYAKRFVELFTIPRVRRTGINIIAFYSSTIFKEAGTSEFNALLASFGFGMVNFLFAWPAIWTIDTFGRRSLLLGTFPMMAWTLLAAGLCTLIPGTGGVHLGLVALFVYLFAAFYSPGEGPVPFTYSSEIFPLSHREVGMAWAVATCLFWAAVLSISFPIMLADLGVLGSFCFYAGLNVIAFVMIVNILLLSELSNQLTLHQFFWVPETKQRTLEELDYVFAVPTKLFMRYQVTKALPYWFKRWVLWQRDATLEPLYKFDLTHEDHHAADDDKAQVEMRDKKHDTS